MSACKWDPAAGAYLRDGEPCRYDEHGDPTKHCTAKRNHRCANHVGARELTCARCVADTRTNLRWIPDLAPLVMVQALDDGAQSEAAMLAGPAADYTVFSARRALDRRWLLLNIPTNNLERALRALLPDDDELHPYSVLTRWHLMLAEDCGHPLPDRMTIVGSADYLDRQLHRLAQDDEQDFPLFRREIRKVREHLEAVLHNSSRAEKGAPCPECTADKVKPERLRREYAHWSYEGEEKGWRLKYRPTPSTEDEADHLDRWVCPRNREHSWLEPDYRKWADERSA